MPDKIEFKLVTEGETPVAIDHQTKAVGRIRDQYSESTHLINMVESILAESNVLEQVFRDILDLRWVDSASNAELDVIGIIVGQPRNIIDATDVAYFGFLGVPGAAPFGDLRDPSVGGRFISIGEETSGNRTLTDDEYILFIKAKILKNTGGTTVAEIQTVIEILLGEGTLAQVTQRPGLAYDVTINRPITPNENLVLNLVGIVPKTAGAAVNYIGSTPAALVLGLVAGDFVVSSTSPVAIPGLSLIAQPGRYDITGWIDIDGDVDSDLILSGSVVNAIEDFELYVELDWSQSPEGTSIATGPGSSASVRVPDVSTRRVHFSGEVNLNAVGTFVLSASTTSGADPHTILANSNINMIPTPIVGGFRRWQFSFPGSDVLSYSIQNIELRAGAGGGDLSSPDNLRPYDSHVGADPLDQAKAFDVDNADSDTRWNSPLVLEDVFIGYNFDNNREVVEYAITAPNYGPGLPPNFFDLFASNLVDGGIPIETRTGLIWRHAETKTFTVGGGVTTDTTFPPVLPEPSGVEMIITSDIVAPENVSIDTVGEYETPITAGNFYIQITRLDIGIPSLDDPGDNVGVTFWDEANPGLNRPKIATTLQTQGNAGGDFFTPIESSEIERLVAPSRVDYYSVGSVDPSVSGWMSLIVSSALTNPAGELVLYAGSSLELIEVDLLSNDTTFFPEIEGPPPINAPENEWATLPGHSLNFPSTGDYWFHISVPIGVTPGFESIEFRLQGSEGFTATFEVIPRFGLSDVSIDGVDDVPVKSEDYVTSPGGFLFNLALNSTVIQGTLNITTPNTIMDIQVKIKGTSDWLCNSRGHFAAIGPN